MRKVFRWSGLFLSILALCIGISGCSGSDADPMATATVQFIDEAGKVLYPEKGGGLFAFSILPGESRQLIVWVTQYRNGGVIPVFNEKVTFTLLTPGNGGSITMVKDRTDSNGRAVGIYTAGNNFLMDEVRATTEAGATAQLTIIKTGGLIGTRISSLTASPLSVAEGQTSTLTATVATDSYGNPKIGEGVTFSFVTNESGACFLDASGACVSSISAVSDAAGHAIAVYRGGGNWSASTLGDTVRATLSNGSTALVSITRVASKPLSITVVAEPASVSAGQASIVTATVTGDFNVGVTVTFSLPLNNSGASLSASSAVTDGSGKAVVTYMAGSNSPSLTVDDTVRAAVGSMSGSVVITRTTGEITAGAVLTLSASPTSVNGGQTTTITAVVTGGTSAGANETVTLTIPVNSSGGSFINASGASASTVTITTGVGGTATAVYKAGANSPGIAVQDTVQGVVTSSSALGAVTITRNAGFSGYIVTVTADPASVVHDGVSRITANVRDNTGAAAVSQIVNFAVTGSGGVSAAAVTTDGAGNAVTNFTASGTAPTSSTVTATVIINTVTYTGSAVVATIP